MNGMKSGEKYLVVGSGISGIGSLCLLEQTGADAVLYDSSDKLTEEQLRERLPEGSRARCIAGRLPEEVMPVRYRDGGAQSRGAHGPSPGG